MKSPKIQDMMDELRYDLKRKDFRKALVVFSYFENIDKDSQKMLLSELHQGEPDFTVPLLAQLMTHQESLCEAQPIVRELMIAKLLEDPSLLTQFLSDQEMEDKSVYFQIAGEIRSEKIVPVLIGILNTTEDSETMSRAIMTLGMIGDPAGTNTLTDFLYSGKRELILMAVRALGKVGTPTAMHRLSERMGTDTELDLLIMQVFAEVQDLISLKKLNETQDNEAAYQAGVNKILYKPFGAQILKETISEFLKF